MSSKTPNYNLHKIDLTDAPPDITVLNANWDTLDEQLKNLANSITDKPAINVDSALSDTSTNAIQNKVVKAALDDKLPLAGGTVTGTLILSKVADTDGDSYNSPALVIGGEPTTYHLELDNNEIQAKQNETTPGNLFLNSNGGKVVIGEGGLENSGDFWPVTALSSNMGTATLPWNRIYGRYLDLCGASDVLYGRFRVGTTGTETTNGVTTLTLGNETPSGTAHNASGKITMYGSGTAFTNILPSEKTTGSNSVTLPSGTGTLMLDTEGCKIQTGSFAPASSNTINCNFTPKVIFIVSNDVEVSAGEYGVKGFGSLMGGNGYPTGNITWNTTSVVVKNIERSSTCYYAIFG